MFRHLPLALALALGGLSTATSAPAQVTQLPNTGCAGAQYPTFVGMPRIGQSMGVLCPSCAALQPLLVIGITSSPVPLPIACTGLCFLGCNPLIVLPSSLWQTTIPNDMGLVGVCLCVQCGCFDAGQVCITLSGALQICFLP